MIYLDVSRLLKAGFRTTPSGIERMELAYVKEFGAAGNLEFVASLCGTLRIIPYGIALAYFHALDDVWKGAGRRSYLSAVSNMFLLYLLLLVFSARAVFPKAAMQATAASLYLNLSHENLVRPHVIAHFKSRTGAKAICFVHDLIPITHPEYVRPGQAQMHRRRIATVAAVADAVLVNSHATRCELLSHLRGSANLPPIHVAHLGVAQSAAPRDHATGGGAYFLCLATIEPRKNHLLLLQLWRSLAAQEVRPPRLIIVGRRGWENEMVIDMLERCEILSGIVEERGGVGDRELDALLRGARALLLPSFAEGFGLPAVEALNAGTPVICSDLPALREICGDVPEYLDPLDGIGWRQAILDYAEEAAPRRAAFRERLRAWSAPRWDTHFRLVRQVIEALGTPQPSERK